MILVTGHFGAVEFLPGALGLSGFPAAIIVRPQTRELAVSLAERAALINLTLIIPENGKVLPAALRALREGRILITEADEFEMWRRHESQTVNFLGFTIPADRTLEVLQKRSGSPLLTAFVRRETETPLYLGHFSGLGTCRHYMGPAAIVSSFWKKRSIKTRSSGTSGRNSAKLFLPCRPSRPLWQLDLIRSAQSLSAAWFTLKTI